MMKTIVPGAPRCFYALKNALSAFSYNGGYRTIVAMDLKTHACSFNCEKPVTITKFGYMTWRTGITYRISLWQTGKEEPICSCLVSPEQANEMQFFPLAHPVYISPGITYYISRTYESGGPHHNMTDYVGWLSNKEGVGYPLNQQVINFSHAFFSDEVNPLQSDQMSDITTNSLLPLIDFEYML